MNYPAIWYKDLTQHSQSRKEAFLRSLSTAKIIVSDTQKSPYGMIFLDNSDKLKEALFITSLSFDNQERMIIVLFDSGLYQSDIIWEFLFAGASKVFDFENTPLLHGVIEDQINRWQSVESLLTSKFIKENLLGESVIWKNTIREMIEIAVYTQSSVLIIGESGTGKEMLSRLIHHFDPRRNKGDLVLVDCSAIASELSGSEFFGHEKGAFTGANNTREGAFSLANDGTLFLDEIGELPLRLQSELLRVIQEGMYKPIGSNFWKKTVFRLVSATNRTLTEEVKAGRFRLDLHYRLSTWICKVPSLFERQDDIPLLAEVFLSKFFEKKDIPKIDESVIEYLLKRDYHGNVRELQQLMQRIASQHVGKGPITLCNIPVIDRPDYKPNVIYQREALNAEQSEYEKTIQSILDKGLNLREIRDLTTQTVIELAIRREKGRVNQAANKLGITSRAIQLYKQKKYTKNA